MRTVVIRLTAGAPFMQWCDTCLVTHAFARIYNADRPDRPPVRLWADHNDNP